MSSTGGERGIHLIPKFHKSRLDCVVVPMRTSNKAELDLKLANHRAASLQGIRGLIGQMSSDVLRLRSPDAIVNVNWMIAGAEICAGVLRPVADAIDSQQPKPSDASHRNRRFRAILNAVR